MTKLDPGLEPGGSPTQRGPSNEDIQARAEELAAEWLRDPLNLEELAITGGATDCYIWTALARAIEIACRIRAHYDETDAPIAALRYIRSILIKAAAPQFLEQARDEWCNREKNDE